MSPAGEVQGGIHLVPEGSRADGQSHGLSDMAAHFQEGRIAKFVLHSWLV